MKKNIILLAMIGAGMAFTACSNEEDMLFDQSAAERLNAASDLYSARLTAQPNGWAMQLYPTTKNESPFGNGYLVLMDFNEDHSVKCSMNNILSGNVYKSDVSAWEVITDNGPVLTFNTFNDVLHTFTDPEDVGITSGFGNDETGTGIGGDYEFIIVDAPEDASYMMLKGKKRGTYNLLTPIEEGVDYEAYLTDVKTFQASMFPANAASNDYIHFGDSVCIFEDAGDGIPAIYPVGGDAVTQSSFNPFLVTKRGDDYYLRFRDAKTFGDVTVQDYRYDVERDIFESTDNPAFYICGYEPVAFFKEAIGGNTFSLKRGAGMSEDVAAAIEEVYNTYHDTKPQYGPTDYNIILAADGKLRLTVNYNPKSPSGTTLTYYFDYKAEEESVTFQYAEPAQEKNNMSKNHFTRVQPVIEKVFNDTFTISKHKTAFDLSYIRLTSKTNPSKWFILQMKPKENVDVQ